MHTNIPNSRHKHSWQQRAAENKHLPRSLCQRNVASAAHSWAGQCRESTPSSRRQCRAGLPLSVPEQALIAVRHLFEAYFRCCQVGALHTPGPPGTSFAVGSAPDCGAAAASTKLRHGMMLQSLGLLLTNPFTCSTHM